MQIKYLWRHLGKAQGPAVLSTSRYGGEDQLNWRLLLCLDRGPRVPGMSVRAGVRLMTIQLPIRRAGISSPRSSVGNRASYGQPAHKYSMHQCPLNTLPSVAYHTENTVVGVASSCQTQRHTEILKLCQ